MSAERVADEILRTYITSYETSLVTVYTHSAYRRTIEAITAIPPTMKTPRSATALLSGRN